MNLNDTRLNANLGPRSIPLPITQRSINLANTAASNYSSPGKSRQIRLNTLAVLAMNDFLQLLQVRTDVAQGDSWGKLAALMDTADLVLPAFGKLECRPIVGSVELHEVALNESGESHPSTPRWQTQTVHVPAEVWDDRIGFVMIQIDEEQKIAELLGFTATVETEAFPLSQLQPMTALVDRLEALQPATFSIPALRSRFSTLSNTVASTVTSTVDQSITRLGDWFHETLEAGWQSIESLALPPAFAFRFREPALPQEDAPFRICRGKVINLDLENALVRSVPRQVSLIVSIQPSFSNDDPDRSSETQVTLSFYPISPNLTLPLFHAAIRDDAGTVHYEGNAESGDEFLEFEFNCGADEQFDVLISGSDFEVIETFGT